ncbi:Fpg/Nei family DNA glycosylase [Antribacter sp. KLBMP9083]|uniref:DNA-(apurinic or apyrimidinic site) lyase n=1 Tax=Antribacter soli TaxID=2910976 RepID=A0AA41QAU1_9MICO|nr:DNA-formamidopyrimidine glycosylase family protein [Antribacter soli]MCF4119711.1 Fpg/Nei family DNA glycosylase [Antribacter soli]
MPEGHTVHRLARTLSTLFDGQTLAVSSPQGRFSDGAALLSGRVLVASEAWGKQLFLGFGGDQDDVVWLRTHLGLYGAWTFSGDGSAPVAHAIGAPRRRIGERETVLPDERVAPGAPGTSPSLASRGVAEWEPPAPRGAVRVRLLGDHAAADLTGPAACEVITGAEKVAVEERLGPDPIRADPGPDAGGTPQGAARFAAAVGRSRVTIGQLLMDQAVVAGVGNIYRAEALHRAGLDPLRAGRDVPAAAVRALWDDLVVLMRDGARTGAIVTTRPEHRDAASPATAVRGGRTRQNTDGEPGSVPADDAFYVYHRDGLPCRVCGSPVLVKELAGRNLFWCGTCQV